VTHEEPRLYEGMYILTSALSEEARQRAFQRIEDDIKEQGGEVVKLHEQGRQRLAYEIARQRDGYYYLVYFKVKPSAIDVLHRAYHLMEDLLRFITLRTEQVKETIEFKSVGEH
jgi:small subunit ribosomal protein S6